MANPPENSQGWVKLYRKLLDKAIWNCSTAEQKVILVAILLLANHEENQWQWKGKKFTCRPGQFITSLPSLAEATGCSIQNVRTALKKFKEYEFLTDESTKTGRLVTIINWEKYQTKPKEATDKLTDDQQTANRQLTSNKNDKNVKKIYTPEFENWYSSWPRAQAKQDSFKNFEKRRKEHGLDFLLCCSNNYLTYQNSMPEKDHDPYYSSNNFFGQKAYYLDWAEPKEPPRRRNTNAPPM